MTIEVKTFSFDKSDSTSTPFNQTVTIPGMTTTPKVIILFASAVTNMSDGYRNSMGFADTTTEFQRAIGWSTQDAVSTTNTARVNSDQNIFRAIGDGGAEHVSLELTSVAAGEFTVTYTANTASSTYPIHGIALGGTDVTNVHVGSFNSLTTTGTQDITAPGWTPDMLFFMSAGTGTTLNTPVDGARMGFGVASSNAKRSTSTVASRAGVGTSSTGRKDAVDKCLQILEVVGNVTSLSLEADLSQKLATGFRLSYSIAPATAQTIFYLAIKGGAWDVSTSSSATSTGNQTITTPFQPKGLITWSVRANDANFNSHNIWNFGVASSSTAERSISTYDTNGVSPTVNARSATETSVIRHITATSTGSSSTVVREAQLSSFNASNFIINWSTASATTAFLHNIIVSDTSAAVPETITHSAIGKYQKRILIKHEHIAKYSHGGVVSVGPITQQYDILGPIRHEAIGKYNKRALITHTMIGKYHKSNVTESVIIKYDKRAQPLVHQCVARYNLEEAPELNLRRYLKPYGIRLFIMSHDQRETYHVFNSFNLHESTLRVQHVGTNLAQDDAGRFTIDVEDSGHAIDTSVVGEGCSVLIQGGKTPEDLGDGRHNVIFGYITSKTVHREATGVLKYTFSGSGSAIRFSERVTNFSRSADRLAETGNLITEKADPNDPDMKAWTLFRDVLTDTSQMPNAGPIERQFTMKGVTDVEPKVDVFIATMENELADLSEPMDYIASSTGATWGINYNPDINDVFLRYATLEPSEVIIKSGNDVENPDDDRFHTAYIMDDWEFTDTRDKGQGFANQLYLRMGSKSVKANVTDLTGIIDQYTPLAVDEPPTDDDAGQQLPENRVAAFGPIINIRSDLIGPFSNVWTTISNIAREFNFNRVYCTMKLGTGTDGPGPAIGQPDWVTPWNTLVAGNVFLLGYIDTQNGSKTVSAVQEEIDRWESTWGPRGIFFDNMSTNTTTAAYYQNLGAYAKSLGFERVIAAPKTLISSEFYFNCPDVDIFVIAQTDGHLPTLTTDATQGEIPLPPTGSGSGNTNYSATARTAVFATGITPVVATDDDIAQWVSDLEFNDVASWFYVTDDTGAQPFDTLSGRLQASMFGAEAAGIRVLQDSGGFIIPGIPVQQDLAMSFQADTQNIGDLAVILSKIGNPIANEGERAEAAYIEILSDRAVIKTTEDPVTGATVVTTVNMPNFTEPIAYGYIPYSKIQNEFPSIIFLHGIVKRNQDISVGQRYWVVLYGRGQNEANTIRWHHANTEGVGDYLAARRIPATIRRRSATQTQQWQVFTKTTHPGFALSYFKNTTLMLTASDSDSIDRFGLVEASVDLEGVDDDTTGVRIAQSIISYSAKPKREFSLTCTVPDDLILPNMLVRIYDDMTLSGQVAGSTAEGTEAEIISADMDWDAYSHPMGCYRVTIGAIGHVDYVYSYWFGKYKRKEVSVQFPSITPKPPGPLPDNNAPIINVYPKGGLYSTALKVTFQTNKTGVKVYYTTNGTDPQIVGADTISSQNNTRIYTPGISTAVAINATTNLKFMGLDTEGRESTIYSETYTLKTATQAGGSKLMFMPYWQGPTASQINNVFWTYMNSTIDYVTYHKRTTEAYELTYQNGALGTPSREQEAEFEGYDEMVANFAQAKTAGFEIIGYNIEGDQRYPSADKKDVVGFCKKFSEYVRKNGLKVKFNPSPEFTQTYGSRIVQYCDFYNIQCQYHQDDTDGFRSWVRDRTQSIRSNNVNAVITITLSADLVQHNSVPGQTRLQTLQNRWGYAKDYVDGIRIFYSTASELSTIVEPFMNWFVSSGRTV